MDNKIYLVSIIILCSIVLAVYIQTVYGAETTDNEKYCSLGQRDNCINIIPQNQPIPINMINHVSAVQK